MVLCGEWRGGDTGGGKGCWSERGVVIWGEARFGDRKEDGR